MDKAGVIVVARVVFLVFAHWRGLAASGPGTCLHGLTRWGWLLLVQGPERFMAVFVMSDC